MSAAQTDRSHASGAFWWTGVAVFVFWNLGLAAGAYAFKAIGLLALGPRSSSARAMRVVALLPASLLCALIAVQTFGAERSLTLDARAAGVAVGAAAAWRKAPFVVVIVAASAVTATVRALA